MQSDRKPNMSQAHDGRFENINKDPAIYSRTKRASEIDLSKLSKRETSECLIRKDFGQNFYDPNLNATKSRVDIGLIELKRSLSRQPN